MRLAMAQTFSPVSVATNFELLCLTLVCRILFTDNRLRSTRLRSLAAVDRVVGVKLAK
jgi:hypothetical protein